MPIYLREGLPGSGKTLSAVGENILPALKAKRRVVTNIILNADKISLLLGEDITAYVVVVDRFHKDGSLYFSKVDHFKEHEGWKSEGEKGIGVLFVVDECHEVLKAEGYSNKADKGIVDWFATHRHVGVDVVLITQMFGDIPAAIRGRVEMRYRYQKLGFLSLPGSYSKRFYIGQQARSVRTVLGRYPKSWFGLYRTVDADVIESLPKQRNILLNGKLMFMVLAVLLLFGVAFSHGLHMPGSQPAKQKPAADLTASPASHAEPEKPVDGPKVTRSPGVIGGGYEVQASQELLDLRDQISVQQAKYDLERLKRERPDHDDNLDGATAFISGYTMTNGAASYFLMLTPRGGRPRPIKASDLEQYGFTIVAVDRCLAIVRGERGIYRLTCDGPVRFGFPGDDFRQGRVVAAMPPVSAPVEHTGDVVDLRPQLPQDKIPANAVP